MLKTTSAAGPAALVEVGDKNLKKSGQGVQVEDQDEKEPAQKSHKGQKGQKTAKSKKWIHIEKAEAFRARNLSSQSGVFFIIDARRAFTKLRQAFIKAPILNYFDPEHHIRIKMDALGYIVGGILNQLTSDDLDQWLLVAFFSKKIIPAETRYETHNGELLVIVKAFKTWKHNLEGCKHEVLVLTDHNNL